MRVIMGKIRVYIAAAVCVFALLGGISHAGVQGGKHDLSLLGTGMYQFDTFQTCVFCHTPHGANVNFKNVTYWDTNTNAYVQPVGAYPTLLWNRSLPTATAFTTYSSNSMDANTSQVRVYSLMCMSCHDGVSALNVLQNYPNDSVPAGGPPAPSGDDQFGDTFHGQAGFGWGPNIGERDPAADTGITNLANDHPISIDYENSQGGGLQTPDNTAGTVGASNLPLYSKPSSPATKSSLECSTCHDVHNEGSPGAGGKFPFLRISNDNSALCLNCHLK